jgi:hypothetical protein
MQDYEKLGAFYLGKEFDQASGQKTDNLVLYDAKDLTTHGVVRGHDRQRQDRPVPGRCSKRRPSTASRPS